MKNTVYSYAGLMERLIDLPALTKPPSPGEKSGAVTCRSRSCRYDEETDTYIKWSVKNEPGAIAYEGIDEHGRYILMEEDGPGVIWRCRSVPSTGSTASARCGSGTQTRRKCPARPNMTQWQN